MNVDVSSEIDIARPRHEVFSFATTPANAPKWYVNIKAVAWETPPPLQVGSRITFTARFLGRSLVYTYEVTELVTDQHLVMRTSQGPFPMETTYHFSDGAAAITRMTLRNRGVPTGFSKVFSPFMVSAMQRANRKDLLRLKTLLEAPLES